MKIELSIGLGPEPEPEPESESPVNPLSPLSPFRGLNRFAEFAYPDQQLMRIATDNGDDTYDCDRPDTDIYMKRVPTSRLVGSNFLTVGQTVVVKFYSRDRRKPYIAGLSSMRFEGTEAVIEYWLSWGRSFFRYHGLTADYTESSISAEESHDNPVHYRVGAEGLYCWSSYQSTLGEGEDPPDNWGQIHSPDSSANTAKVWHDLLLSEPDDQTHFIVGLNSETTDVELNDGSPTGPTWTEGQVCVFAINSETMAEEWQTCLETFEIEGEDDGGGIDFGF